MAFQELMLLSLVAAFIWLVIQVNVLDRRHLRSLSATQLERVRRETTEMLYW